MVSAPGRSSAIPLAAPVLALLLGTALGGPAAARECVDYRDTTHWTSRVTRINGNRPSDVVARYPYAYVSYSALGGGVPELAVIDVSDPQQPKIISSVPIGRLGAIALRWPYVFVTDPDLWIVDVSDPAAPAVVSQTGLPGTFARSVVVDGNTAWVSTNRNSIRVMDVSDVTAPVEITSIPAVGSQEHLALRGNLLFSSENAAGVRIFDVANPAAPVYLSTLSPLDRSFNCTVLGDVAYVGGTYAELIPFDVKDPTFPVPLDVLRESAAGGTGGIAIQGKYAYVPGQFIADVTDPRNPKRVAPWRIAANATIHASDGFAYECHQYLHVLQLGDLPPPAEPALLIDRMSGPLFVDGTRGYLGVDPFGPATDLLVLDLSNPDAVRVVGELAGAQSVRLVQGRGPWAFALVSDLALNQETLETLDVSDPSAPEFVGSVVVEDYFGTSNYALSEDADYAYVVGRSDELTVVDVSDRSAPAIVGTLPLPGPMLHWNLDVSGDHVYVEQVLTSLDVIDVSDPTAPAFVTSLPSEGFRCPVVVDGTRLYYGALRVADISDPANPVELSRRDLPADVLSLAADGNTVYCSTPSYGTLVLDVSDPGFLQVIGNVSHPEHSASIVVGEDRVWVTGDYNFSNPPSGLYSIPKQCAAATARRASPAFVAPAATGSPNPARDGVRLSFTLPQGGPAEIRVHDVRGRRVWEQRWTAARAGSQEVRWDGRDLDGAPAAAGVYFFVVRGGDGATARGKITLVR